LAAAMLAASVPDSAAQPAPAAQGANQAPATTAVVHYDASFFKDMAPNTAFDMILRLPGFAFDGGAQVRGFAGSAGNVLIDGERPTSKEDDLQSILKRVPASQVDHIDVIRGGAPGIDMHGQTVVANVIRRTGSGVTGVAAIGNTFVADGRLVPDSRFELTSKSGPRTLELSLVPSWFLDDGTGDGDRYRTDPDGALLVRSHIHDRAGGFQTTGTAAYETPLWGGKFRVNLLGLYMRYFDNADDNLIVPGGTEVLRYREHHAKGELGLHFERTLTPKLSLEALAIQRVQHQNFPSHFTATNDDELFNEADTSGETIGRAVLHYKPSEKLSAEASAEGDFNIQTSHSTFAFNDADVPLPAANVTVSEKRGELAALTTWRPSQRITVEAGMRVEVSQIKSDGDVNLTKVLVFPKPRVVLTWSPNSANQLRLRLEREVGQLNFADFAASSALGNGNSTLRAGNPDLEPSRDWAFEADYEKHIQGAVLVIGYRRLQISDVVDRIPIQGSSGVFDAPGNIGSAQENDIITNITLPLERLGLKHAQFKAQGTLRHSRVADPTTGEERTISGQHRFDYELHFTQDLPKLKSNWGIDVYNRWTQTYFRFNEIDVVKLKTFVGAFYEYKPRSDVSWRLELSNLTARGLERDLYVYSGPRNTSGLSYTDKRKEDFNPYVRVRLRKTFG
jgi:hypothetical protein